MSNNTDSDYDYDYDSDILNLSDFESDNGVNGDNYKRSLEFMPWSEYHRPQNINDILAHSKIKKTLAEYIEQKVFPHLMFYGPPGTGKTSTIRAFAKEFYGKNYDFMVLEINASENRGIDVVRQDIKNFVLSTPNFRGKIKNDIKLVILDEADHLTIDAQGILRYAIEKYTKYARFSIICNEKSKIISAIESRTTIMKFTPIENNIVEDTIKNIAKFRKFKIDDECIDILVKVSHGDLRYMLNKLQALYMEITDKKITSEIVSRSCGYPSVHNMKKIIKIIKNNEEIGEKIKKFKLYMIENRLTLSNVITELARYKYDNIITNKHITLDDIRIFQIMSDIEISMCYIDNDEIHSRVLVSSY
jgi:replication factor C subunit 3/5